MNYFKRSIVKFFGDFLSKVIYDLIKIILVALFSLVTFKLGVDSFFSSIYSYSIFALMIYSVLLIVASIFCYSLIIKKRVESIKKRVESLNNDLNTDKLTGLPNDRALSEYLNDVISYARKEKKTFSIILMDIDDFKRLNTDYGLTVADEILAKLGEVLRNDSRLTDKTFRQHVKGDEFIVIAKETSIENARKAAERKRDAISKIEWEINDLKEPIKLTVSCGVVEFNGKDDSSTILNRAFEAMKTAKSKEGKNNVVSRV